MLFGMLDAKVLQDGIQSILHKNLQEVAQFMQEVRKGSYHVRRTVEQMMEYLVTIIRKDPQIHILTLYDTLEQLLPRFLYSPNEYDTLEIALYNYLSIS
jgi:DNA polymerase III gamma/tau subunit